MLDFDMDMTDDKSDGCLQDPKVKENRKITDKHGLFLLVSIFSIWLASCGYVISSRLYPAPMNINSTQTNSNAFKQYFINKKWLFDTLTYEYSLYCDYRYYCFRDSYFNLAFAMGGYHAELLILFCWVLLYCTFVERKHYFTFYTGLIFISIGFIVVSMVYRIALSFVSDLFPEQLCYKNFLFWVVPELILVLLILIAAFRMRRVDPAYARHKFKRSFRWCQNLYCAIIFAFFLVMVIISIKILTVGLIADLSWTDFILYVIVVGSCYIAFFLYNFGNAVTTNVIWNMVDGKKGPFKTLLRAIILVCRYHLGSVALRATVILPLLVIRQERSNIKKTFEGNVDKMFGVRIQSELERSKERPNLELVYYKTRPPDGFRGMGGHCKIYWKSHYIVQVCKSSMILVVVYGLNFRYSTRTILLRHSLDKKLPSSTVFLLGLPYVSLLLLIINEISRFSLQLFDIDAYNAPYFHTVGIVAYSKIALVTFTLGMMLMNNFELTTELWKVQYNEMNKK